MKENISLKKIIIFSAIALIAIGFGYYNVCISPDYITINAILQSVAAAIGFIAISEIAAIFSKMPVVSYIITSFSCAIIAHAMTPWGIVFPRADMAAPNLEHIRQVAFTSSLITYIIALVVSLAVGLFIIHRKDVFKTTHAQ